MRNQHSWLYWHWDRYEREQRAATVKRALADGLAFLFVTVTLGAFMVMLPLLVPQPTVVGP